MILHVLTAVSRPENLGRVAESLSVAAAKVPEIAVVWHWRFDLERRCVGGQELKNQMLDEITDGWVWILDDDTLVHEDVLSVVWSSLVRGASLFNAVIVSQVRTDGRVLAASPENVRLGYIDAGQAFLSRSLIGDRRIPHSYEGDFHFLDQVLKDALPAWTLAKVSLHNAISGVDVSA